MIVSSLTYGGNHHFLDKLTTKQFGQLAEARKVVEYYGNRMDSGGTARRYLEKYKEKRNE